MPPDLQTTHRARLFAFLHQQTRSDLAVQRLHNLSGKTETTREIDNLHRLATRSWAAPPPLPLQDSAASATKSGGNHKFFRTVRP